MTDEKPSTLFALCLHCGAKTEPPFLIQSPVICSDCLNDPNFTFNTNGYRVSVTQRIEDEDNE